MADLMIQTELFIKQDFFFLYFLNVCFPLMFNTIKYQVNNWFIYIFV